MSSKHQKIFDIDANLVTHAFKDFVDQSLNKAHLLKFLSKSWFEPDSWGNMQLILSGGFDEETIDVTDVTVINTKFLSGSLATLQNLPPTPSV